MAEASQRWARWYWLTAVVLLPLVNSALFALLSWSRDAVRLPEQLGLVLIAVADWLVLSRVSAGAWEGLERTQRLILGVAAVVGMSVAFAYLEFIVALFVACSQDTCNLG